MSAQDYGSDVPGIQLVAFHRQKDYVNDMEVGNRVQSGRPSARNHGVIKTKVGNRSKKT